MLLARSLAVVGASSVYPMMFTPPASWPTAFAGRSPVSVNTVSALVTTKYPAPSTIGKS